MTLPCRRCGNCESISGSRCKCKVDLCKDLVNIEHDCECPINRNNVGSLRRSAK